MKYIKHFALVFLLFAISKESLAQDSLGALKLFVYPDSVRILVDDTINTPAKSFLKLKAGNHRINVTGKHLKSVNKSFVIKSDSITTMHLVMKKSDEYLKYNKQMFYYKLKVNTVKYGGAFLPFGLAGLSYLAYNGSKNTANAYRDAHNLYLTKTDVNEMNTIRNEANDLIKKYDRQYYGSYILAGAAVVTTYLYLKYNKRIINNIKKPVYIENISSNIFIDQFNNYHLSLNYKF